MERDGQDQLDRCRRMDRISLTDGEGWTGSVGPMEKDGQNQLNRWRSMDRIIWTDGEGWTGSVGPMEKDGQDQLDRSCEKRRSITKSQRKQEYPLYKKNKEG